MKFQPKSREEIDAMGLMKAGVYSFRVANANEQTSKSGNEMIKLTLEVFDDKGVTHNIFDYLLEAMSSKLYGFCHAANLTQQYQLGQMRDTDCIGKAGYVEITVEKGKENPQGGFYPDKNQVKSYLANKPKNTAQATAPTANPEQPFDDEIPF